jgi:alpha-galactosidase
MKIYFLLVCLIPLISCLDNGLARTPAMGWNSWNKFGCSINETLIKEVADAMVSTGLAAAGYEYVNLDDCWQISRDKTTSEIQADPKAFPSGIQSLADYVHNKSLKFGLYSDAGLYTCQKRPGGLYHEEIDAQTYAKWGVDYLKYDNCFNAALPPKFRYPRMRDALNKTGRPIYYSLCEWGQDDPWEWAADVGNSWRTTGDIKDKWDSFIEILEKQVPIASSGAPGGWNDPDMLEVGNGGMTTNEYEAHFALWAFLKAPLIVGCDIRNMSNDTLRILTNKEIIAVNQDSLGKPATRLFYQGSQEIWGGPVVDGFAAVLFNQGTSAANITAKFKLFNITGSAKIRDLQAHQDLGTFQNSFSVQVQPHSVVVIKLSPQSQTMIAY